MDALESYIASPKEGAAAEPSTSTTSRQEAAQLADAAEDLKTDIPYFEEQPKQTEVKSSQLSSLGSSANNGNAEFDPTLLELGKTECELSDYSPWDESGEANDENYMDDSVSVQSSEYGSSCAGHSSYYQSPTPTNGDLMIRPPSHAPFHYNYSSPSPPGATAAHGMTMQLPSSASSRMHAAYPHSQTMHGQLPPTPPGCYPNMWFPNAPYGSGGGRAGSMQPGVPYARYGGYGAAYPTHPAHPTHMHAHHTPHHGHHTAHHQQHPLQHQHPHETMMEMFQLSNSGREARNRAEKNRRDKLNGSIQELSTMVPHVAESPRRVDKTAVLRFAAHGLRLKYVFGNNLHQQQPQITDTLMGMLDSFFLTLTCHGQILLISSSIEQHLGHCQTDLYGQSILHITHPDDQNMLKQQLIPSELENLFDASTDMDENGEPRLRSKTEEDYIDRKLREDRRSFRVRLARAGPRSEPTAYEVVKIDGCFRRSDEAPRGIKSNTFSSSLQLIRRTRGRDDAIPLHTISGNDIVLTACARIIRPPKISSRLMDANVLEYRTRHLIDGRIIDCDQRIGLVAGYMTDEVRNLSPFTFIHNDDVRWVIVALRQMYDCNSSYGESTYRLFTRNGNIIYLQTKGYLEIEKESNKVHSFVCVNTLLGEEEGKRRVQDMKNKFSVIINTKIPQSTVDVPASEHPAQLEKAVLCLIQNLQSASDEDSGDLDDYDDDSDEPDDEGGLTIKELDAPVQRHHHTQQQQQKQQQKRSHSSLSQSRTGGKPSLALVPPEAATVKSSISKSVSVVNVTAAKHLRAAKSPNVQNNCSCQGKDSECSSCQSPLTPETTEAASTDSLKRRAGSESEDVKLPKRYMPATEIEQVLSSSLEQIERNLHRQLNVAKELLDQSNRYELPHATECIDEIIEEHQKQSELYVNIKSEYEVQLQNRVHTTKSESEPQDSNAASGSGHV